MLVRKRAVLIHLPQRSIGINNRNRHITCLMVRARPVALMIQYGAKIDTTREMRCFDEYCKRQALLQSELSHRVFEPQRERTAGAEAGVGQRNLDQAD